MSPRFIPGEVPRITHERWRTEQMALTGDPTTAAGHDRFGVRTLIARGPIRAGTAVAGPDGDARDG